MTPPRLASLHPCARPEESDVYAGYCRCGHALTAHRSGSLASEQLRQLAALDDPPSGWVRADLPGDPLVLTIDAGGERWTLTGKPCHGGDGIELLTEGERRDCAGCDGGGRACPDCGGRGYTFAPLWLRVRFEYDNAGDGTGEAFLYVRAPGGGGEARHAIRVRKGDALRCRWPVVTR